MQIPHNDDHQDEMSVIQVGNLTIDLDNHLISYPDGRDMTLTVRECEVLRMLIHSRGRVLSYAVLGRDVWRVPDTCYSLDGLRNCICHLRQKLGAAAVAIQTVRNVGYRFHAPLAARPRRRKRMRRGRAV